MQNQDKLKPTLGIKCEETVPYCPKGEDRGEHKLYVIKNTEERIWNGIKKGDQNALGELYRLYADTLFIYGTKHTRDRDFVMDCIHDLFVDLYKYRKGLAQTDNIKIYLVKSLKRKIFGKNKERDIPFSKLDYGSRSMDRKGITKSHEEELIHMESMGEKKQKLENALKSLTERQRTGLMLKFSEKRTYREISEILGISIESARTFIYRTLKNLR